MSGSKADTAQTKCDDEATNYFVDAFRRLKSGERVNFLFTAALVVIGLLQYRIYTIQSDIMRNGQRAWIAPVAATGFPIRADLPISLEIVIANTGREPATRVRYYSEVGVIADDSLASSVAISHPMNVCRSWEESGRVGPLQPVGTVYPTTDLSNTYKLTARAASVFLATQPEILEGKVPIIVSGCFAYATSTTADARHYSPFCFVSDAAHQWHICGVGPEAD